jgi:hypothetical protein
MRKILAGNVGSSSGLVQKTGDSSVCPRIIRRKEIDHVSELTAEELKQELKDTAAEYAALPGYLTLQAKGRHLNTWAKIL